MSLDPATRELLIPAIAFLFGASVGSFLNVVIYRLPRSILTVEEQEELRPDLEPVAVEGLSISFPRRSFCPQCKEQISGWDNLPILSYFVLAGKCRKCRAPIPLRYFFVELFTATLFATIAVRFQPDAAQAAVWCAFVAALLAVTFIDADWTIIPDSIDLSGIALAPLLALAVPSLHAHEWRGTPFDDLSTLGIAAGGAGEAALISSGIGIAAGGGLLLAVVLGFDGILWGMRKLEWTELKESMGYGDVKLLAMIGGFVGWKGVLLTLILGCIVGSIVGIAIRLFTGSRYIPFGPFLALGAALVVLFRPEMYRFFEWYMALFGRA